MTYFQRLRRPLIIVSPDFPLDEAIEVRPRHPGRICGAQGSEAKPEAPAEGRGFNPAVAEVSRVEVSGPEELALSEARSLRPGRSCGTKTTVAQDNPAERPTVNPEALARRPAHRHPAEGRGFKPAVAEVSRVEGKGAKRSASRPAPSGPPDPGRHERRCRVCSHPDRDAIEEAFIHWHSPTLIAQDYQISDDSLYRHAYATGLDAVRSRNLRCALERILEKAQRVIPTAESIVRAARAYTRINDAGEWVEPPMHVIVSSGPPAARLPGGQGLAGSAFPLAKSQVTSLPTNRPSRPSNRGIPELENGSTR